MTIDYDQVASEYARHRRVHPGVLSSLVEGIAPGNAVLEVGCGTGNYLRAIADAIPCEAWGIEPSAAMRAHVADDRVTVVAGHAERFDLGDRTFDLAYSVDVIHHVADIGAYFCEVARVLRPGGRVCTVTDSDADILRRRPLSRYFPETIPIERGHYPTSDALRAHMRTAGLTIERSQSIEHRAHVTDAAAFRERAFSCLHLIAADAHLAGVWRLEADLVTGPVPSLVPYTLYWARRP